LRRHPVISRSRGGPPCTVDAGLPRTYRLDASLVSLDLSAIGAGRAYQSAVTLRATE